MIYRSWSMLTGTAAVAGGAVASVVFANFILAEKNPFLKAEQRKPLATPTAK